MGLRVLLLLVAGASTGGLGCKDKSKLTDSEPIPPRRGSPELPVGSEEADPATGSAADASTTTGMMTYPPSSADAKPIALALPTKIAPPPPFDTLRRWQKRSDLLSTLGSAVREATNDQRAGLESLTAKSTIWSIGSDEPLYATALPRVFAQFASQENRLSRITFVTTDPAAAVAIYRDAVNRWGDGDRAINPYGSLRTYSASEAGWSAQLETIEEGPSSTIVGTVLALHVAEIQLSADPSAASGSMFKMFADVGTLIGQPLTAGKQVFGDAFVIESADEEDGVAEKTEARQGYADVTLPWSGSEWTTVLRVDQQTGKVVQATIQGATDEYEERVELMKQLKAAYGKPSAIITDAGYQRIGFSTKTLIVTLTDDDPLWTIEMHAR
jgi:hypothetical protein